MPVTCAAASFPAPTRPTSPKTDHNHADLHAILRFFVCRHAGLLRPGDMVWLVRNRLAVCHGGNPVDRLDPVGAGGFGTAMGRGSGRERGCRYVEMSWDTGTY